MGAIIVRGSNNQRHVISDMDLVDYESGDSFERQAKKFNDMKDDPNLITRADWNNRAFDTETSDRRSVTIIPTISTRQEDRVIRRTDKKQRYI